MSLVRALVAIVAAMAAGLGLAFVDTSANFDDTGIAALGLVLAAFLVVLIDGSGQVLRVAMLAVLVGIWIPVLEIATPGQFGPLLALVFSAVGATGGLLLIRLLGAKPASD